MLQKLNRTTAKKPLLHPVKILQFGTGNFLRAFFEWMVDLANEKQNFDAAVQIAQVNAKTTDTRYRDQEGLYHVVLNGMQYGKTFTETRLITCVAGVMNPFEDYDAYLRAGENPDLQFIVSNTTEAGINFLESDRTMDTLPESFPGKLTALLYHRYKFFNGDKTRALTILPCELIEKNGEALRDRILQYAVHWNLETEFKEWINAHTLFCNTLVDRIVPGFPKDRIDDIRKETGFDDQLTVAAEPFHLFVIEPVLTGRHTVDSLRQALPFEQAGMQVKLVKDLAPYRTSKVRILNGAHTAMVPVAYLRGLRTVRESIEDAFTGDFMRKAISEEILPTLDLPRKELEQFAAETIERFQNPFIRHELKSIALNSVSKFQVRVLPTILDYIRKTGKLPDRLLYSFAALILFYRGEWRGEALPLNDTPAVMDFFRETWKSEDPGTVVNRVLSNADLWKADLTTIAGFAEAVERHLRDNQSSRT